MDDLRGEVQKILAGRTDGGGSVDPFNERNEWEDAKRSGKAPKAAQLDKPKSRRAQQAQAPVRNATPDSTRGDSLR